MPNFPSEVGTDSTGRSEETRMGKKDGSKPQRTDSDMDLSQCPSQMKERELKDVSVCGMVKSLKEKRRQQKSY